LNKDKEQICRRYINRLFWVKFSTGYLKIVPVNVFLSYKEVAKTGTILLKGKAIKNCLWEVPPK
jgi:hypothetical protein